MRNRHGELLVEVRPNSQDKVPLNLENGVQKRTSKHKDVLLMQVPNVKESQYYAGMAALKAYFNKKLPELKVFCLDPITPFFDKNIHLIEEQFGLDFNTFTKQGKFMELGKYTEMNKVMKMVEKEIKKYNPTYLGFSLIDGNVDASLYTTYYIKKRFPNIKIVLGGKGVDLLRGGLMAAKNMDGSNTYNYKDYDFIDFIVYGDGEVPFTTIIENQNSPDKLVEYHNTQGLAFRQDKIWLGWDSELAPEKYSHIDFSNMPTPDYSDFRDTVAWKRTMGGAIPIILSRGCPFKCSFCSIPTAVPNFNYRDMNDCIDELDVWYNRGHRDFFIHDSIINFRPDWLKEYCERIVAKNWEPIHWGGNMRLMKPMRDIETLRLYNKAGFYNMITGLESASPKVLRHMKKYSSIQGIREIFDNIREINKDKDPNAKHFENQPIRIMLQLIVGYINESEEDFQMTLDFVEEYSDVIYEILTCSLFLCWYPLVDRWEQEGNWIQFKNEVEWDTEFNSLEDRLDRGRRLEDLCIKLGLEYNIYLRESISRSSDRQNRENADGSKL